MNNQEANIEITRIEGVLQSISVVMPIWDKIGMDEMISVNVPLFGIKTFAEDLDDAEIAVKESLTAFCINAEKFGKGLETELKIMGWCFNNESTRDVSFMSFNVPEENIVVDQIMQTGEQFAEKLQIAI
jgi:hypothetical protein